MNQNVVYVGIDVDDVSYHASALDRRTGEVLDFRCRPTLKGSGGAAGEGSRIFRRCQTKAVLRSLVRWLITESQHRFTKEMLTQSITAIRSY